MSVIWKFLFIFTCLIKVEANYGEFLEKLELEKMFRVLGPKSLLETFSNQQKAEINIYDGCKIDLRSYVNGIEENEIWALKMLDSSSKIPTGLLIGNFIELGMFDQCMSIYIKKNYREIYGNHCTYTLSLLYENKTLPINPIISICLPLSCQPEDLNNILEERMKQIGGYETFNITDIEVLCSEEHTRELTGPIIAATIIGTIFASLLICTILAELKRIFSLNIKIPEFINEISLYKSTRDIFILKDNPDSISALHGLRFLSTIVVIFGHDILIRAASLHVNNLHIAYLQPIQSIFLSFVVYSVDTFLTISGFLMSYSYLRRPKLNLVSYYFHRYVRLTPAIAAVLLVTTYIVPIIGSGPKWRKVTTSFISDTCKEKWWTILLYVNNIIYKEGNCLAHLWSTAVDMQLFWISPLILYPLAKKPKMGLSILGLLLIASILMPAAVIALNNYPFSFYEIEANFSVIWNMWINLYTQPYTRASPWLIGIFLGYLVNKGPKKLKKTTVIFGWLMTIVSLLFCISGFWALLQLDYVYDVKYESIFAAISRPIWSAAISWVIFASTLGYGGPVNTFLSSSIFFPLSRLSYCLYIVHIVVEITNSQISRTPSYFMYYQLVFTFISDFILALVIAYFVCILFEMPARTLEKFIFQYKTTKHQKENYIEKKNIEKIE